MLFYFGGNYMPYYPPSTGGSGGESNVVSIQDDNMPGDLFGTGPQNISVEYLRGIRGLGALKGAINFDLDPPLENGLDDVEISFLDTGLSQLFGVTDSSNMYCSGRVTAITTAWDVQEIDVRIAFTYHADSDTDHLQVEPIDPGFSGFEGEIMSLSVVFF